MRILLDTNVILDILQDRRPHVEAAASLWALVETRVVEGYLAAHSLTTVFYLLRKAKGGETARRLVLDLMTTFAVADVTGPVLTAALALGWSDFEDAVTAEAAFASGCDYLATRDPHGFAQSPVTTLSPAALAAFIRTTAP